MARAGRGYPNRPVVTRPRQGVRPVGVTLPVWETVSEWLPLTVTTPDARLTLRAWETVSEWPALTVKKHAYATLPVWETVSEWAALLIATPVLPGAQINAPGQAEFNGTLWGAGTPFRIESISGWRSKPQIDNLNVEKPSSHGAWPARRLAQQRLVTIKLSMIDSIADPTQIDELLDELDAATGISETDEPLPLVIRGQSGVHLAYGVVIDGGVEMDADWSNGSPGASILIACAAPYRYSVDQHGVTIPKDTPTALANSGNASSHPVLRIAGPAADPVITNSTLGRTIELDLTIADGEMLEIDTGNGTAVVGETNVIKLLTGSGVAPQEFVLASGSNLISFTANSGGTAGLVALWRDATL